MPCTGSSSITAWVCILCISTKDDKRAVPRASGRQRPEPFIIVHLGVPTWASEIWGDEGGAAAAAAAAAAAKSLQSCPTVCDPRDSVQPQRQQPTRLPHPWGSTGKNTGVACHFLLQCMKVKSLSCVRLLATPWTAAYQAPPSMGFSRQEYWSGNAGDMGSIPGSGRSPGEGNGHPLQNSCLGDPMDRRAWWAIIHGVAKQSDTT